MSFRVNINVSERINDWFVKKAEELGVTRSALMCMALNEYIDQKEGMKAMGDLQGLMGVIEKASMQHDRVE